MYLTILNVDNILENLDNNVDDAITIGMILATTHIQFDFVYSDSPKENKNFLKSLIDYLNILSEVSIINLEKIKIDLENRKNVLIVADGNSIRAIVKKIMGINDDDIVHVEIPTGVPIIYEFDKELNLINKTIL